eukprot:UN09319
MITPSAGAVMTNDDDIVAKIMSCTEQTDMGGMKDKEKHVNLDAILSAVMIQSRQQLEIIAREERNKEEISMQEEGFNIDDIFVDDKSESNETNKTTGDGSTTTGGVDDVTDGVNVDIQL